MKKKSYLLIIIIAIIFLLNNFRVVASIDKVFKFPSSVSMLNVAVNRGEEFSVEIEGSGWYANRYSRDKISILLRTVDNGKTKFNLRAIGIGEAYMFFSLVERDKYLHILIKEKPIKQKTEKSINPLRESQEKNGPEKIKEKNEGKTNQQIKVKNININKKEAGKAISGINQENNKGKTKKNKQTLNANIKVSKPQNSYELVKKKKEPEIYYIDNKSKKKVEISVKDENKDYFEGIARLKSEDYLKAIELLNNYLNKCEKCKYNEDAIFHIAKAYDLEGNDADALKFFEKILSKGSGKYYIEVLKWMANYYYGKKDLKKALNYYQKLFNKTKDPGVEKKIADIAYNLGEFELSLEGYNYCINNRIVDDEIIYRLASIYDKPGKYRDIEKAYSFYHKIVESYPKSKYFDISKKRVSFFEKNFINLR